MGNSVMKFLCSLFNRALHTLHLAISSTPPRSAAEKVEGNNDLLSSILLRLPPKLIFRLMCVSKRWNNIVSDQFFVKSYGEDKKDTGGNLLAFIKPLEKHQIEFLPIIPHRNSDSNKDVENYNIMNKDLPSSQFIAYCNGLILYGPSYHVMNLVTGKGAPIPIPKASVVAHPQDTIEQLVLVSDTYTTELLCSFKVVRISGIIRMDSLYVEIYSSKTGNWAKPKRIGRRGFRIFNQDNLLIVSNGVLHWMSAHALALYDTNVDDETDLQLINLPGPTIPRNKHVLTSSTVTRSLTDDVLWYGSTDNNRVKFWKLPKDESGCYRRATNIPKKEWVMMHRINKYCLCAGVTALFLDNTLKPEDKYITIHTKVCDDVIENSKRDGYIKNNRLKLKALLPWNNSVVALMSLHRIVFLYNFERNTVQLVQYEGDYKYNSRWRFCEEPIGLSSFASFNSQ